ncbi:MAG: hypothetical protein Q8R30_04930 [bacterium]|nr:hypothetical protein [bacterium]MDZ4286168.1 hypothetical protein [Candidatus Sungbacteria bacterium]
MDILKQYEKQNPEIRPQAPVQSHLSEDSGFLVRMTMKLSGGRIQNEQQANKMLVGIVCLMAVISALLLFSSGNFIQRSGRVVPIAGPSDPQFKTR